MSLHRLKGNSSPKVSPSHLRISKEEEWIANVSSLSARFGVVQGCLVEKTKELLKLRVLIEKVTRNGDTVVRFLLFHNNPMKMTTTKTVYLQRKISILPQNSIPVGIFMRNL